MVARPQTTVPLDDTSPGAVVQVHEIQGQKKMGAIYTSVLSIFIYTPEKAGQKYRHGKQGKGLKKHTQKKGLNSHGEGGL